MQRSPAGVGALSQVAIRWLSAYLVAGVFPIPVGYLPGTLTLDDWYTRGIYSIANWTQAHVFGLATVLPLRFTGSGDMLVDYAHQFDLLVLSLVVALIWTLGDRARPMSPRVVEWIRLYLRLCLATIMLGYGLAKVLVVQFPPLPLERYVEPIGDMSPMGLLWTFMGYSTSYSVFTGLAEVAGAVLLVFRRTATLGGLITVAVMTNVVMLNFGYDVPLKMNSSRYLLMAVFIAAPDLARLFDVLVRNRPTQPRPMDLLFGSSTRDRIAAAVGVVYFLYIAWFNVGDAVRSQHPVERQPLFGIYDVEEFTKDGVRLEPSLSQPERWRWFVFREDRVTIRTMADTVERFTPQVEATGTSATLTGQAATHPFSLTLEPLDRDHLLIRGEADGAAVLARVRRIDENNYLLKNRGFHWIQEEPFNR